MKLSDYIKSRELSYQQAATQIRIYHAANNPEDKPIQLHWKHLHAVATQGKKPGPTLTRAIIGWANNIVTFRDLRSDFLP